MKFTKNQDASKEQDDAALLGQYRMTGSLEVLGALYDRYIGLVYGVCLNYLKDEEAGKDAVMQIFEELILKLKLHEIQNFRSWLHVLTRNHCLMILRRSARIPVVSMEETFVENEDFVHLDITDAKEQQLGAMEKCLESLVPEQKTSVELFYLQEKCYKEVAEITGYDLVKVKSYIQNGKRNLKICIEKTNKE